MNGPLTVDPVASKPTNINDIRPEPPNAEQLRQRRADSFIRRIAEAYNKNDILTARSLLDVLCITQGGQL